ncbi:N-acetyl-gamma-glutamyl-phosphate reductase [Halalkalibacter wakoensis JCM 9140]|uniref:N-acetyl-gamma-glutamyl-phosphate reductase n=1 Tax=Halalkalibacter wakoensis JCM 9140 TaxID=1236970 RepID=W4PZT3_9BACI|nr:N-acetyl-gamma-glutamyl-phosphate reductase [Halalkalibacter wakoensis]GAE25252.1 N-acetyl-gamma-glutamyl-phosphate reductase [Halalkalibacter wakoensis JCM 9140]
MRVGIIGATGYGGAELLRLLHQHPHVEEVVLYTSSKEGMNIQDSYPHVSTIYHQTLQSIDHTSLKQEVDTVFLATPPGVSAEWSRKIAEAGCQVIDLSGDLRLEDPAVYEKWYKREAAPLDLIKEAVYGLPEWNRKEIETANIISNPGCYPTATLLGLAPLVKNKLIETDSIIVDAKSGTSGAGRSPSAITHFSEMNENFKIYQINQHKHIPEIEQNLQKWDKEIPNITFQPHLVPMVRGIMATIYAKANQELTEKALRDIYEQSYENERFVRIRPEGAYPATKEVYGSNYCDIGVTFDERTGRITVVSVIDNVVKGASGQAIQNYNIMNGFEESTGLTLVPMYP